MHWSTLIFLLAAAQGLSADSCERIVKGSCYNPSYSSRICLNAPYTGLCDLPGYLCCTRFQEVPQPTGGNRYSLCNSYGGQCHSQYDQSKFCVEYIGMNGLCTQSHELCCLKFMGSGGGGGWYPETGGEGDGGSVGGGTEVGGGGSTGAGSDDGDCGEPEVSARYSHTGWRIVNGDNAPHGAWPWQVSLKTSGYYESHFCGGSILDENWILTAAHCVRGKTPYHFHIVVGEHLQNRYDGSEQKHKISQIVEHHQYSGSRPSEPNDIALLRLAKPIKFNKYVKKVCLPAEHHGLGHFDGKQDCWITGWGMTQGTADENHLQQLNSRAMTHYECLRTWGYSIDRKHICTGTVNQGACGGDSGGPMVCREGGKFYQVGVTSWGTEDCYGMPSVYTRVKSFMTWIKQTKNGGGGYDIYGK